MQKLINDDWQNVDLKSIIGNKKAILVIDPPFNIGYHYNSYKDKMNENEYYAMLKKLFNVINWCGCVIIHYPENIYKLAIVLGYAPLKVVSWVYNSNTVKQHRDIAFFGIKPDFKKITQPYKNPNDKRIKERIAKGITGCKLYDWWFVNQVKNVSKKEINHPCVMPVEIMKRIIGILPDDDVIIVDAFMRSGTTGIACKELNKNFIGIEINKDYFEIANKRINEIKLV